MKFFQFLVLTTIGLSSAAWAHLPTEVGCDARTMGLPKNEKFIFSAKKEKRFNEIIDRIAGLFKDEVRLRGSNLKIIKDWKSKEQNAYALQTRSDWEVHILGGYYRHKDITDEGLAEVVCHELGHHLAGAPYKMFQSAYGPSFGWASTEGQADYWGFSVCLKKYFEAYPQEVKIKDKFAKNKCDKNYEEQADRNICYHLSNAALSSATMLESFSSDPVINFSQKTDPLVTSVNSSSHPATQCRYDTYMAGALCQVEDPNRSSIDPADFSNILCANKNEDEIFYTNNRPKCWFNGQVALTNSDYTYEPKINSLALSFKFMSFLPSGEFTFRIIPINETQLYVKAPFIEVRRNLPQLSLANELIHLDLKRKVDTHLYFNLEVIRRNQLIYKEQIQVRI